MATTVILATNRLQEYLDTVLHSSITYINVQRVQPLTVPTYDRSTNPPSILSTQWYALLFMKDGRVEKVPMGAGVHAGWSNDAAGYVQFEIDFYAAFPAGGGGGGTVTSVDVDGGATGFTFTGGPIVGSGIITMSGAPSIPYANTLWVDDVNGVDATGTRGVFTLPYLTIQAAIADAQEGDLIDVRPGVYAAINDAGVAPTILFFNVQLASNGIAATIGSNDSIWTFYGAAIDSVTVAGAGFAFVTCYGGVDSNAVCEDFNTLRVFGDVGGTYTVDASSAYIYNGRVTGDVILENAGTLIAYQSSMGNVTTATSGALNGIASNASAIDPGIVVSGDVFKGTFATPDAGNSSVVNTDGSWSWSAAKQNRLLATRTLVDTDTVNIDLADDVVYLADGTASYTEDIPAPAGKQFGLVSGPTGALTFVPFASVDGIAGNFLLGAGTRATILSLGAGVYIKLS